MTIAPIVKAHGCFFRSLLYCSDTNCLLVRFTDFLYRTTTERVGSIFQRSRGANKAPITSRRVAVKPLWVEAVGCRAALENDELYREQRPQASSTETEAKDKTCRWCVRVWLLCIRSIMIPLCGFMSHFAKMRIDDVLWYWKIHRFWQALFSGSKIEDKTMRWSQSRLYKGSIKLFDKKTHFCGFLECCVFVASLTSANTEQEGFQKIVTSLFFDMTKKIIFGASQSTASKAPEK